MYVWEAGEREGGRYYAKRRKLKSRKTDKDRSIRVLCMHVCRGACIPVCVCLCVHFAWTLITTK